MGFGPLPGGGIGGTTGTTDNAITTANGTGGSTLQGTVATVAPTTGTFAFNTDTGVIQFGASKDVVLSRGGVDILEQKRGVNAQTLNVYNTFTDASNYERISLSWAGNVLFIVAQGAGLGQIRAIGYDGLHHTFYTNHIARWSIDASGNITAGSDNTYTIGASGSAPSKVTTHTLNISSIPTSSSGLSSGDVWSNLGILTIVS